MIRPPILYIQNFVDAEAAETLFNTIWESTPWEMREGAPRREYWINPYRMPYTYGSGEHARTYEGHDWAATVTGMLAKLLVWDMMKPDGANIPKWMLPDCCFLNGYIDGNQHLGWHADDSPEMEHCCPISVLSLGAAREIWVRPKGHKGEVPAEWRFVLEPGSLFVMESGMQLNWDHRIPKASFECGPRVSLTYRRLVEASVIEHGLERARAR